MRRFISYFVFLTLFFVVAQAFDAEAAERIRMGMVGFESKAPGVSQTQASIVTDLFTRSLANSKTISILEREQIKLIGEELRFNMSGLVDMDTAVEIGRIKGLQYMILGAVTELSEKASGGGVAIPIRGIGGVGVGGGSREASATIDIRIVDVATSEIVLALSESGRSANSTSAVSIMGFSYAESEFGGLQARAIADAVERLAHQIRSVIGGESSHVISMSSDGVIIDIGSTMGAKEGALYLVYADGKTLRGMNNEVIGYEKIPLAVIRVRDVSSTHSTCSVAPPSVSKMIQRGDKIEPITASRAKNMKFATSRPAASSRTFDQMFGDDDSVDDGAAVNNNQTTPPAVDRTEDRFDQIANVNNASDHVDAPAQTGGRKTIPGFDPDNSTDARVVQTYDLDPGTVNMLGIRHRNAINKYNSRKYKDAYDDFCGMADEFRGDYLAAYWAGVSAQRLKNNDDSLAWIERALAINPNYKPAEEFKRKTLRK